MKNLSDNGGEWIVGDKRNQRPERKLTVVLGDIMEERNGWIWDVFSRENQSCVMTGCVFGAWKGRKDESRMTLRFWLSNWIDDGIIC